MGLTLREALRSDEMRGELRDLVRQELRGELDQRVEEALSRPSTAAKVARSGRPDMAVLDGAGDEALASAAEKRLDARVGATRRALAGADVMETASAADQDAAKARILARTAGVEPSGRRVSHVGGGVLESLSGSVAGSGDEDVSGPVRLPESGRVVEAEFAAQQGAAGWAQRGRLAGLSPETLRALGGSAA
jgi:hypothetical protein